MAITILIAPFLGEMVGGELDKKQNFDFGFSDANDTRLPCSDAGAKTTPPAYPPDTQMTHLTCAISGVPKTKSNSKS